MTYGFAILGRPRTGSNHLVSLLNSHSDIVCYGEIFRSEFKLASRIDKSLKDLAEPSVRLKNAKAVVDRIVALNPEVSAVGFKVFPNHVKFKRGVFGNRISRIVSLVRDNDLAVYSSGKTASITGHGALRVGQAAVRARIRFDSEDFARFRAKLDKERRFWEDFVASSPQEKQFRIAYEDINDPDRLHDLQSFLGVTPETLASDMQKRNPADILDRFENPDDAASYLAKIGKEHWARE